MNGPLESSIGQDRISPQSALPKMGVGSFFKGLELSSASLERLQRISSIAYARFSQPLAQLKKDPSFREKAERNLEGVETKKTRLFALKECFEDLAKKDSEDLSSPLPPFSEFMQNKVDERERDSSNVQARMQSFSLPYQMHELQDFESELQILFMGEQPKDLEDFQKEMQPKLGQLETLYKEQSLEKDPLEFQKREGEIKEIKGQLAQLVAGYVEIKIKGQDKEIYQSTGIKIVANLLKGFKTKLLLQSTSNTHGLLKELHQAVEELKDSTQQVENPELRRQIFGHITYIKERSFDLVNIEKTRQRIFPLSIFAKFTHRKIDRTYQNILDVSAEYYKSMNFNDDEVEKYRALSLEAHRPKREHLMMYVNDILGGASRLADRERIVLRSQLIRDYILNPSNSKILTETKPSIFELIDQERLLKEDLERLQALPQADSQDIAKREKDIQVLIESNKQQIEKVTLLPHYDGISTNEMNKLANTYRKYAFLDEDSDKWKKLLLSINLEKPYLLTSYQQKMQAIRAFQDQIILLGTSAKKNPHIGNNNLKENLSMNTKEWKKQQEEAKEEIQVLFNQLKKEHALLRCVLEGKDFLENQLASSAKELTKARNDYLGEKMRWDTPIIRTMQMPSGPAVWSESAKESMSIRHQMSCPNSGYPSSSFRGREAGPQCIQPNLQRVEIFNNQEDLICDYTSSATNVEFFQRDDSKRKLATEHQTAEILLGKVDRKITSLPPEIAPNDLEHPMTIDIATTLLLSPDLLRPWLMKNEGVKNFLNKHGSKGMHVDSSVNERQLLEESLAAWMLFSKESKESLKEFTFVGKNGLSRCLIPEFNVQGERVFKLMDKSPDGDEKITYIQFDISCYNVGCNKWTKMIRAIESLDKALKRLQKKAFS